MQGTHLKFCGRIPHPTIVQVPMTVRLLKCQGQLTDTSRSGSFGPLDRPNSVTCAVSLCSVVYEVDRDSSVKRLVPFHSGIADVACVTQRRVSSRSTVRAASPTLIPCTVCVVWAWTGPRIRRNGCADHLRFDLIVRRLGDGNTVPAPCREAVIAQHA